MTLIVAIACKVLWLIDVLQLKKIDNKKIRSFYEAQNEKLDDWLEVDLLVKAVSDDVIDSLDPADVDGDGVPDPINGLHATGESIEPFLPEDEREARRKGRRNARWAINVCYTNAFREGQC